MGLKETIFNDFKEAFKSRQEEKKSVLSMILAEIKNKEISLISREKGLDDEQVLILLRKAIKQRSESAEAYRQGGREELAEKEMAEVKILENYLPREIDDQTLDEIVLRAKEKIQASGPADLGAMMKEVMPQLRGLADGKRISQAVLKALGGKN